MTGSSSAKLPEEQKLTECIILAGGLGTRLKEAVPELPKCLAPVAGKPFLYHIIHQLQKQGIQHFIFSLGYKHEYITEFLQLQFPNLDYSLSIETEPLGTGGAIQKAISYCHSENIAVMNGDTFFHVSLRPAFEFHFSNEAACTLILKLMFDFDRYGAVQLDEHDRIIGFLEKQQFEKGLINGGIYILNKEKFFSIDFPEKFSFEKDYLEKHLDSSLIMGYIQNEYFIDIGIPEDFKKANLEISKFL